MQLSKTFSSMTKLELIDDICEYWQARDSPFRLSVKKGMTGPKWKSEMNSYQNIMIWSVDNSFEHGSSKWLATSIQTDIYYQHPRNA